MRSSDSIPLPGHPVRGSRTGQPIMAMFDLLGRPWAMGTVWQLRPEPLTFRSLQDACGGVSPSILNKRLQELRAAEIVERAEKGYQLTESGRRLADLLAPLADWSDDWARSVGSLPPRSGT